MLASLQFGRAFGRIGLGGMADVGWGGLDPSPWEEHLHTELGIGYLLQLGPMLRLELLRQPRFGWYISLGTPYTRLGTAASEVTCDDCPAPEEYPQVGYNGISLKPMMGVRVGATTVQLSFVRTFWINGADQVSGESVDARSLRLDQLMFSVGFTR